VSSGSYGSCCLDVGKILGTSPSFSHATVSCFDAGKVVASSPSLSHATASLEEAEGEQRWVRLQSGKVRVASASDRLLQGSFSSTGAVAASRQDANVRPGVLCQQAP